MTTNLINATTTWNQDAKTQQELMDNVQFFNFNNGITLPEKLSAKYVPINTAALVENLLKYTFDDGSPMFEIRQVLRDGAKSKNVDGCNQYRHRVHLRTTKALKISGNDTMYPEIVIFNSYNGTNSLKIEMGLFRLVCSNGLTIKSKDFGSIKINHIGEPARIAADLVAEFVKAVPEIGNVYEKLAHTVLSTIQIQEFAKKALEIKETANGTKGWTKKLAESAETIEIIATEISKSRRKEDDGNGLWEVYNRIQENVIAGGITIEKSDVIKKTRTLKGTTHSYLASKINSELIALALQYANNDSKQLLSEEVLIPTTIEEVALESFTVTETVVSSKYENPKRITITLHDGTKKRVKNPNYIPTNQELELV